MLSHAFNEIDILKTKMTALSRTADLMYKRNIKLQRNNNNLKIRMTDSEQQRYNVVIPQAANSEAEDRRILRIVKAVLNATEAPAASERRSIGDSSAFSGEED